MCKCVWCNKSFERSDLLKEKDMGLICHSCYAAISSRGEQMEIVND